MLPDVWPGNPPPSNPWSKVTSATTKLPFAHEQGERGGDKQRICLERLSDAFLRLTSETRVLTALVFPVHLALSRKNMRETQRKACDRV